MEMRYINPWSTHCVRTTRFTDNAQHRRYLRRNAGSFAAVPLRVDGSEQDAALSKSEFLTRPEVIELRGRRVKQLAQIYRDQYWLLMEELKLKYREYYWEYGKSPFVQRINSDNDLGFNATGRPFTNLALSTLRGVVEISVVKSAARDISVVKNAPQARSGRQLNCPEMAGASLGAVGAPNF
ncbi:hypothetical protein SASPL_123571 [Salvia splendens]|uniref:Uncharacterized protein n=1 Tax=Salvia splendens TaxID=180675 RepID=A0A8X8ZS62_SALSN|nr:hypothetical protein SASPL_123571 [Salvia splendens]